MSFLERYEVVKKGVEQFELSAFKDNKTPLCKIYTF